MNRKNIADIRNDYKLKQLDKDHVSEDPTRQFEQWLNEAIESVLYEPTAMTVSTVSTENRPSSRIVLLKKVTPSGLVFFTNYHSRKGQELTSNPYASLNFFWPELERQVRIEGRISKVSDQESDEYFQSRPRGSQLSAIASPQSQKIEDRSQLENAKKILEINHAETSIPRPPHWGGYLLEPDYFEFWQGRQDRLHDRIAYYQKDGQWTIERLAP